MKTLSTHLPSAGDLLDRGLLARPGAVADVRERREDGPGGVGRVLDLRLMGGLDVEIWPDRGLDLGPVWWHGIPLSWTSPVVDGRPLPDPRGTQWLSRFRGGLVTTCGTDNIGPPTATAGLHGRHSHLPAADVRWERRRAGTDLVVRVSGVVEHVEMFGRRVVVHRSIEARTGRPEVVLRDEIVNEGHSPVPVPVLYHVNLGAPVVRPGTRVLVPADRVVAREPAPDVPDPSTLPDPVTGPGEAVVEHVRPGRGAGRASVTVAPPGDLPPVEVGWDTTSLPRLFQWVWPSVGGWALGVEPANAALFGPERDGPTGGAPLLEPGASVRTDVTVTVRDEARP